VNGVELKVYEVGGCVRDSFLGVESNDIDYAINARTFDEMRKYVTANSKKIFLEKPEQGIIRYLNLDGIPEDMALCIKNREQNGIVIETGSIEDDLSNRDFTINAIAKLRGTSEVIDPFNGVDDIQKKIIRCVRKPEEIFKDDPVRMIRAIRFKIQFDFSYDTELDDFFNSDINFDWLLEVDRERVRQELDKCFKVSVDKSLCEVFRLGAHFREVLFLKHELSINIR